MINPWRILGVHRKSTQEEIKRAYRDAMRTAHPDAGGTAEQSVVIVNAYKILTTPKELKTYMEMAALVLPACPSCRGKGCTFKQKGLTERIATACTICGGSGFVGTGLV